MYNFSDPMRIPIKLANVSQGQSMAVDQEDEVIFVASYLQGIIKFSYNGIAQGDVVNSDFTDSYGLATDQQTK